MELKEIKKMEEDKNIIEEIISGSIAEELDINPGDILININGNKVKDIIDYKYLISDENVVVEIEKNEGEIWQYEIEKEYDEDLGIIFTNPLIDKAKSCKNKCMFCFIDQLPPNMRETLYFKDDDSRLSFLQGNFITLTNMSDDEIDRIIKYKLSPINISVHTTNPELRVKMLKNKNAGKLYDILKRFNKAKLKVNCQIVLVRGINDGEELQNTLRDLSDLYPTIESVAVVPVGITKYRQNLEDLSPFDRESSNSLLEDIFSLQDKFLRELNTRFVFLSDEFFALTDKEIPSKEYYEGFPQLENGVGLIRSLEDEVIKELENIDNHKSNKKKILIATGTLAYDFLKKLFGKIQEKFEGLQIKVIPINNYFFGDTITVSGLITGGDLIEQVKNLDFDTLFIPRSMMKTGEDIFLDNLTVKEVEKILNTNITISEVDGKDLIENLKKEVI
jgi:putative radical SAM enzyme (TIGR03279 family)